MRAGARRLWRRAVLGCAALAALLGCKRGGGAAQPTALASRLAQRLEPGLHRLERGGPGLPYRLFVPAGYEPARRYPLVLYLHHAGLRGDDNLAQLDEHVARLVSDEVQAVERAFVLAPQCPAGDQWVNAARKVPYQNYLQAAVPPSRTGLATLDLLDEVGRAWSIDPDRLYVTGSSMGGTGTWDFVTRNPGRFAAAVPVNGINDPGRAAAIATLPIWAFHGAQDDVSPVGNTRAMVDALRRQGSPVRYTEFADLGHGCEARAWSTPGLFPWLFAQRRGKSAAEGAAP